MSRASHGGRWSAFDHPDLIMRLPGAASQVQCCDLLPFAHHITSCPAIKTGVNPCRGQSRGVLFFRTAGVLHPRIYRKCSHLPWSNTPPGHLLGSSFKLWPSRRKTVRVPANQRHAPALRKLWPSTQYGRGDGLIILFMNLPSPKPVNCCRACGGTSYHHLLARNEQGVLRPTQTLICDGCARSFPDVQTWRDGLPAGEQERVS